MTQEQGGRRSGRRESDVDAADADPVAARPPTAGAVNAPSPPPRQQQRELLDAPAVSPVERMLLQQQQQQQQPQQADRPAVRPQIQPVARSSVLDRARLFLPELRAANARLPEGAAAAAGDPVIVEVEPPGPEGEAMAAGGGGAASAQPQLRELRLPDGTVLGARAGGSGGGSSDSDGEGDGSGEESESGSDRPDEAEEDGGKLEVAMDLACGVVELRDEKGVAAAEAAIEKGGEVGDEEGEEGRGGSGAAGGGGGAETAKRQRPVVEM